jgi:hypothetical protein
MLKIGNRIKLKKATQKMDGFELVAGTGLEPVTFGL